MKTLLLIAAAALIVVGIVITALSAFADGMRTAPTGNVWVAPMGFCGMLALVCVVLWFML